MTEEGLPLIKAKVIDLPHDVHALTTVADDGSYVILLNARDTRERNKESYLHEVRHIDNNDFYCAESSDDIEYDRH